MHTIAHIINPVKVPITSDLHYAQPITFETMRRAKAYAQNKVQVELLTTQFPEDHEIIPNYFTKTPNLTQSVLDVNDASFKKARKLPLIKDILDRAYQHSQADYIVYTNVDIAVMPSFYEAINSIINQGHDAFIINRRRVANHYTSVAQIPLMVSEVGRAHPGFDCFVFHRKLYPHFVLDDICVGIPFIGISLAHNLFCFASNFKLFTNLHLTIHIGMEIMKNWGDKDYYQHNQQAFKQVRKQLMPHFNIQKFPYAEQPFYKRYISWLLNPSMQIGLCMRLEFRRIKAGVKYWFYEVVYKFIFDKE